LWITPALTTARVAVQPGVLVIYRDKTPVQDHPAITPRGYSI
jgi:hypothetical protein